MTEISCLDILDSQRFLGIKDPPSLFELNIAWKSPSQANAYKTHGFNIREVGYLSFHEPLE